MSDVEFSDGDLDVESPATSGCGTDDNKRHARAQHNALERRRRDNIKDMYTSLREEIPNFTNSERASRAQILRKTIDQISDQNSEVQQLENEIKQIQENNAKLADKIAQRDVDLKTGPVAQPKCNAASSTNQIS